MMAQHVLLSHVPDWNSTAMAIPMSVSYPNPSRWAIWPDPSVLALPTSSIRFAPFPCAFPLLNASYLIHNATHKRGYRPLHAA